MSQRRSSPRRKNPYAPAGRRAGTLAWLGRLVILFIAVTAISAACFVLYSGWLEGQQGGRVRLDPGDPNLDPARQLYLQTYLAAHAEGLSQPAGEATRPETFVIAPGESAGTIAANLVAQGLLRDDELFLNYVRYYGLDARLEAGTYLLPPGSTIPELAASLTTAVGQEVGLRFLEGWRLEEMADYLAQTRPAQIDPDAFLALARREMPADLSPYDFLASLPPQASLEGFLFPDSYRLPAEATAQDLLATMLANFGRRVTPQMRQQFGQRGLSLLQAVTLASIVERETVLEEERPVVASVFLNRLAQGTRLDADPTVQYALGRQADGSWWKSPLSQDDLAVDSPYNTYLYAGMPPGPIASPGLASLQAVAEPSTTAFLYFVADCDPARAGAHLFSESYEQHLANVQKCR